MSGRRSPSPGALKRLRGALFRPTREERVMPAEVRVLGWSKGERTGTVVRGAGGPRRGDGGGNVRTGGRVPRGAKVDFAFRAGYAGWGRVPVERVVEPDCSAMLRRPEGAASQPPSHTSFCIHRSRTQGPRSGGMASLTERCHTLAAHVCRPFCVSGRAALRHRAMYAALLFLSYPSLDGDGAYWFAELPEFRSMADDPIGSPTGTRHGNCRGFHLNSHRFDENPMIISRHSYTRPVQFGGKVPERVVLLEEEGWLAT